MLIDWFTVIAQLINFLLLVWLLRKFLYKPVLKAIQEREDKIAREVEEARQSREAAEAAQKSFEQKNREWDQEKKALWTSERELVKSEKEKWLEAARQEADAIAQKRAESLLQEQQKQALSIASNTEKTVFQLSRTVLEELAGLSWEDAMQEKMLQALDAISPADREKIMAALPANKVGTVVLRSAFPFSPAKLASLHQKIAAFFTREIRLEPVADPSLISGFEIDLGDYKLSWNISAYISQLQQTARERLKEKSTAALAGNSSKE